MMMGDHSFTDAPSARPTPPTRQPTTTPTPSPCTIPHPAIPPPTSTTYDPNHQCTKCLLTPSGPALCPDALVPTPSLDSLPANMAAESYIGPPQATSQVSLPSGLQVGERLAPQDIPLPHSHHVRLYTRSSLLLPPSSSLVFSLLRTNIIQPN